MKKFLLLTFLILFSCDRYNPRCINASDFGQPMGSPSIGGYDIQARFGDNSTYNYFEKTWSTYTGFVLTGDVLIARITGAWSPWSEEFLNQAITCNRVNKVCNLDTDFDYQIIDGWEGHRFKQNEICDDGEINENICWFPYGLGIYMGFSNDPRSSLESLYHLAHPQFQQIQGGYWKFILPQEEIENIKEQMGVVKFSSIKIYLRSHDNSYDDNISGCVDKDTSGKVKLNPVDGEIEACITPIEIFFESGARREESGFLETAARIFMDPAESIIHDTYHAIVESPVYQNILRTIWALFIVFIVFGWFGGFIQLTHTVGLLAVIKFGIITSLVSPTGWAFFNDFVVQFFWSGSSELANMVMGAFNGAIYSQTATQTSVGGTIDSSVLQNVDDIISMFTSGAVNSKIAGLLWSHELGFILILALYFAFYVFIMAMLKLTVILIFIFISITILLALAPIFLVFSIFKYTRELYFESWLQALISAAIQPMMLFCFIGIFMTIIDYYLKEMLFYEVCWKSILNLYIYDIKFWKIQEVYNYVDGVATKKDNNTPNITFVSIFVLFLSTMIIRYVTEMVPQVSERIGGSFSLGSLSQGVMAVGKTLEYFGEEMAKGTMKGVHKRTTGRALSGMFNKFAPDFISRNAHKLSFGLVNKTDAARMAKAKKTVRAELRSKGWKDKDINDSMRKGRLNKKLGDQLALEKAKDDKYGRKSLGPKAFTGAMKGIQDNIKMSMAKAQARAQGKKFTKKKEKHMEKQFVQKEYKEARNSDEMKDKTDKIMANKFGSADLRDAARELKSDQVSGKAEITSNDDLREKLKEKMAERGYSNKKDSKKDQELLDGLIDKDLSKGRTSRINAEFGDLDKATEEPKDKAIPENIDSGNIEGEVSSNSEGDKDPEIGEVLDDIVGDNPDFDWKDNPDSDELLDDIIGDDPDFDWKDNPDSDELLDDIIGDNPDFDWKKNKDEDPK